MKRNNITDVLGQDKLMQHKQRVAFHEAGHAAGIYLNSKARKLPPVFFKIILKDMHDMAGTDGMNHQADHDECGARLEGGRLIESAPSIDGLVTGLTEHNEAMMQLFKDYMIAFEADIVNLLIGPLAEAKHVADTDDELFNHKLVNLRALKNYGGSSDLALANEYLQSFPVEKHQKDSKLDELFNVAFEFINNDANWAAITKLADYILCTNKNIIYCEEVVSMLDQSLSHFQSRIIKPIVSYIAYDAEAPALGAPRRTSDF